MDRQEITMLLNALIERDVLGKQTEQFFNDAISNTEPLTNDLSEWRLHTVKKANRVERRHGTEELLYSMLKSGK